MTRRLVIASKVIGPTNLVADRVITARTSWPRFWRPRATSTALYAPIPPLMPSAININYPLTRLPNYQVLLTECPGYLFGFAAHSRQSRPLGEHDAPEPVDRLHQFVVDHDKVVLDIGCHLFLGHAEPFPDGSLAVFAPAS